MTTTNSDEVSVVPGARSVPLVAGDTPAMREWAEQLVARARAEGVELTGDDGLLTAMIRQVLQTGLEVELSDHLGCHGLAGAFSGTNVYANDIAAIPSLHAAYPLMIAVFFWERRRVAARAMLVLYVGAMALTLVYTAEHYVVDILLGWLYAMGTAWAMRRFWPREASSKSGGTVSLLKSGGLET